MSLKNPKSFEEFLNHRKFSIPNDSQLNPEIQNSLISRENFLDPKNYDKKNKKRGKHPYEKEPINSKFLKEKQIKQQIQQNLQKPNIEELRNLKFLAIEKDRMLEKRKKAIILIQKIWRGFVQYVKFHAFKYFKKNL